MLSRLPVVVLIWCCASPAEVLELNTVVRQGLQFSPEVRRAESIWRAAEGSAQVAERRIFPTIEGLASAKFKKDPSRASAFSSASGDNEEEYDAGLHLVQPLYRGGALTNGIGSFRLTEQIEHLHWFETRQTTVESLVNAFYDLAESEKRLAAVNEHRDVLKSYFEIVSRYERIGRSRRMDRLQAAVNLSLTESEKVTLDRTKVGASDALKRLLGTESPEVLGGQLKMVVAPAAPLKVEEALQAALENNPEFKIATLQRQKREYDNGLDFVEDLPQLNIEGNWGYRAGDRPDWFEESSRYYAVGLVLKIPLFSGLTTVPKRRIHSELIRQEDRNVEIKRLDLRQRLLNAIQLLGSEFERLTVAQNAVKQGQEALKLATDAYRQGVASSQDVLSAQGTRYNSEKLLIETQFSYLRALLQIRRLMGVDLEKVYEQ